MADHYNQPPHSPLHSPLQERFYMAQHNPHQQPYQSDPYLDAPPSPFRPGFRPGSQTPSLMESNYNTPNQSTVLLPIGQKFEYAEPTRTDKYDKWDGSGFDEKKKKKPIFWVSVVLGVLLVAGAAFVAVYFLVIKPKHAANATGAGSGNSTSGSANGASGKLAFTGGNGTTIKAVDGSSFIYRNEFGGFWVDDPNDPYSDNAAPNSWTPPLNSTWVWGKNRVNGVNLGGWFVLEPFISPALFQKYPTAKDEWTLSEAMAADTAGGGLQQLEQHYDTFITEQDIAEIAGAGLNWVRIPIPFWAIDTWPGEPFLAKTSWKYIVRALGWCKKYGLRVNIDLHTAPGSQNAYNHSGRLGQINFLYGPMGIANAQRMLDYIRTIAEFISQPQWKNVVPVFGIVNEAIMSRIGKPQLTSFYIEAHNLIRSITGTGEGNGPYIAIHDAFALPATWANYLPGADRLILDDHAYFAFDGQSNTEPIATGLGDAAGGKWPGQACSAWGANMRKSQKDFGVSFVGEFSNGYNDCGLYVIGIDAEGKEAYGDCTLFKDSTNWNDTLKAGLQAFAEASMDSLGDWFFWTWKIGKSNKGIVEAPLWSYQLGLEQGWMPKDPRQTKGKCQKMGVNLVDFDGNYSPSATGAPNAPGAIDPTIVQAFPWPPPYINGVPQGLGPNQLPQYTQTGTIVTLPPPTPTATGTKTVDPGNGWFNPKDTVPAYVPIATCQYPDQWLAATGPVPPPCGGGNPPPARRSRR